MTTKQSYTVKTDKAKRMEPEDHDRKGAFARTSKQWRDSDDSARYVHAHAGRLRHSETNTLPQETAEREPNDHKPDNYDGRATRSPRSAPRPDHGYADCGKTS